MRKLIKKILCISLALLLMVGALSGCGEKEAPATEPPAPTEPETEAKVLKVLTLGHSLSVDSNHMINLVAAAEGVGQYDELVIKALLYSLSLFPIGSYVFLSDGKVGRVVDVNPENPKHPIVQLVGVRDESGKLITIKTSDTGLRIVRVLNKQETADIVKATGVV